MNSRKRIEDEQIAKRELAKINQAWKRKSRKLKRKNKLDPQQPLEAGDHFVENPPQGKVEQFPVSYTHLTLPTILLV